jgi:Family of unknown function (DUF6445)
MTMHSLSPQLIHHGTEQQPVLVIDNFVADPEMMIEDAAMLAYQPMGPHYPGLRANVPSALVNRFMQDISGMISEVFNLAGQPDLIESLYSIVTKQPADLKPIQRLPHFDSVEPGRIAVLHYLARSEAGGTAFYRHRTTGFESVSADQLASYTAALENDVALHGVPPADYIAGDTPIFEQIAHYEARFNRAIIYRGNTLHCAHIPSGMALPASPQTGRLTVNTFLAGEVKDI